MRPAVQVDVEARMERSAKRYLERVHENLRIRKKSWKQVLDAVREEKID